MSDSTQERLRIIAIHPKSTGPSLHLSRLIGALSAQGAQVEALEIDVQLLEHKGEGAPTLSELKAEIHSLAESFGAAITGGAPTPNVGMSTIEQALDGVKGDVDACVLTNAELAVHTLGKVATRWPKALRVGVDGDFHVNRLWGRAAIDALVTPHPTLGAELAPIREGRARLYAGGPISPKEGPAKRLGEDKAQVVMSFSRLSPSEVDPLLFQLSLTEPERYHLLFLPSGRPSVDDLVRNRAAGYGLSGKRPKVGSDPEPWIRGADLIIGHPAPEECSAAIASGVPLVLFAPGHDLPSGDMFLVQHGLALHAASALTLAVQVDAALPGGSGRDALEESLERLETDGAAGAAGCVLRSLRDGRLQAKVASSTQAGVEDDDLEEIGAPLSSAPMRKLDARSRKAYLKEIIVQQRELKRQIDKARSGVDTWSHRVRLAQRAKDTRLEREARMRVEGIEKVLKRLVTSERAAQVLRERFSGSQALSATDCAEAERLMSPEASATISRLGRAAEAGSFARLEIEDALTELKRRMGRED